jgi:hypothetical protein
MDLLPLNRDITIAEKIKRLALNPASAIQLPCFTVIPALEYAKEKGVSVFMTLQTIRGYVHMFVYDRGRDMTAKGVVPLGNMLPETAYVKLGWVLGQVDDPAAEDFVEKVHKVAWPVTYFPFASLCWVFTQLWRFLFNAGSSPIQTHSLIRPF